MEEAESRYFAIRAWWLSLGTAFKDAIQDLNLWLAFWYFQYQKWGGFMQMVSLSYLAHLVIKKSCMDAHLDSKLFFFLSFQELSLEEMANMPSCN
jgi:hypothetical protein